MLTCRELEQIVSNVNPDACSEIYDSIDSISREEGGTDNVYQEVLETIVYKILKHPKTPKV